MSLTREEMRSAHSLEYSNDFKHLSIAAEYALYLESDSKFAFRLIMTF